MPCVSSTGLGLRRMLAMATPSRSEAWREGPRDYDAAIRALNQLQSNAANLNEIKKGNGGVIARADLKWMEEALVRVGVTVR